MRFSILVPTRNRPSLLDRCLRALSDLTYPKDRFEVLVIDDGTWEPLDPLIARYSANLNLRLFRQQNRGPAIARNLGLRHATGDYIVFTDDDCRPAAGWLEAFERAARIAPHAGWGGSVEPAPENTIFGNASQLLVTYLYNYISADLRFFCSNNLAFPRQELQELGGFDETFPLAAAEDRDLSERWSALHRQDYVPDATVVHQQRLSFPDFCRQHYRYGRGAFHYQTRRRLRGKQALRVEPIRFYLRMLSYPWRTHSYFPAAALSILMALSQAANMVGFFHERVRSR